MTVEERLDRHDKQIATIGDLVKDGMRLVVETRKDFRKLAEMQIATSAAQKRTEESLNAFIRSMTRGGNGHEKKMVD
jgi:hypothetical protein